ncbi:MAG TPA: hypothetical protein PKK48_09995 [Phycisphaerae bacterium]|nr:hypothetical protein [Phycisphaerae bacterium]
MATVYKRKTVANHKWMIRWYDAETGRWHATTGYADRQASLAMGEKLEQETARRAAGIADPIEQHNRRTLNPSPLSRQK